MKVISSYFGNRILKHVAEDMRDLARDGFTGVVHTFTENDLRYYKYSFTDIVRESHEAGLDVDLDPWGVGGVFGGEAFSAWIGEHRDSWQVSKSGIHRPLACLNSTEFREYMAEWVNASKNTGAKGLFWDEPHFYIPSKADGDQSWTCCCNTCKELFFQKYKKDIPDRKSKDFESFQAWTMLDFLSEMLSLGKKAEMRNTVCILPSEFASSDPVDWRDIAALDGIDIISTDPYWFLTDKDVDSFVTPYTQKILDLAEEFHIEPQIWIQGFRVPAGREEEIERGVEIAFDMGIRNFAIWGFEACRQMSHLKCDNAELAWFTAIKAFKESGIKEQNLGG